MVCVYASCVMYSCIFHVEFNKTQFVTPQRFVKIENMNQGKSNWWTVNLDVKLKPS